MDNRGSRTRFVTRPRIGVKSASFAEAIGVDDEGRCQLCAGD